MSDLHVCSTEDATFVHFDASESAVSESTFIGMGNCALCENKLRESEETEPLVPDRSNLVVNDIDNNDIGLTNNTSICMSNTINTNNIPNSYSYPLFYDSVERNSTISNSFAYQKAFAKSCSLSSMAPGLKATFSPSYLDCRLRYIRQTRRLQKYLRITPEGHLLVNDVKQYPRLGNPYSTIAQSGERINRIDCESFHPLSSLISAAKLRRIHAAYWNLESRQDLLRSRSATAQQMASGSSTKHTSNASDSPPDENEHTRIPT
ncbi:hypothetical protein FBUS_00563 [Fasciolopsis buskii]|uniref:Uncharacterized protein n=1 Tax=Fasciolopsis buskii TaxID=27845 RepID=A0A8E0RS47_9TREM|nr:hypothetical protein FBUS_00563 [Fasciolopsis buski]